MAMCQERGLNVNPVNYTYVISVDGLYKDTIKLFEIIKNTRVFLFAYYFDRLERKTAIISHHSHLDHRLITHFFTMLVQLFLMGRYLSLED